MLEGRFMDVSIGEEWNVDRLSRLSRLRTRTVCVVERITTRYRGPIVLCSVNGSDSIVLRLTVGTFCPRGPPFPFLRVSAA